MRADDAHVLAFTPHRDPPRADSGVLDHPPAAVVADYLREAGVTRQLVAAANSILAEPEVSEFRASFQWTGAIAPPGGVPTLVELPAAAGPLLARAERLLKSSRRDPGQIVTGPIVMVRHLP